MANMDLFKIMMRFVVVALVWMALVLSMTGCASTKPLTNTRDSVRIEYRLDSIYVYKHDSVFRDRWRAGDTIYVQVEKWCTRYKDKIVIQHDTIATTQTEQVAVKYVPDYYKNTSAGFWVLLVLLLAILAFKAYKLYMKFQTGGLWKL